MINKIIDVLKKLEINQYLINETQEETLELFFIKKELDMKRAKSVSKINVTVYNQFEKDNKKMLGSASCQIFTSMNDAEISAAISDSYLAASYVQNPYYKLPASITNEQPLSIKPVALGDAARSMTEALFKYDDDKTTFINSAELFVSTTAVRIVNSNNIDVNYNTNKIFGEFVVQCIRPNDVETYQSFAYDIPDTDALSKKVSDTLEMTRARSTASSTPPAGRYTTILSGEYVRTLLNYYLERSSVDMVYSGYSNYNKGFNIHQHSAIYPVSKLTIQLKADVPFSNEGIAMQDIDLITDGIINNLHGNARFSYYMNIPPTGTYKHIIMNNGKLPLDIMKQGEYLHIVNFSDFQMNSVTGNFGGEIRLAFYSDGKTVIPVTGGSISGSINDIENTFSFSTEMQSEEDYDGPFAVSFKGAVIAG